MLYLAMVFTLENSKHKGEEVGSRARDVRGIDHKVGAGGIWGVGSRYRRVQRFHVHQVPDAIFPLITVHSAAAYL